MNKVEFTLESLDGAKKKIELRVPFGDKFKVIGCGMVEAYMIGVNEYIMWEGEKWLVLRKHVKDWSYE